MVLCLAFWTAFGCAEESRGNPDLFRRRAEKIYVEKKSAYLKDSSAENGVNFALACFDWADFSRSDQDRERIGEEGVKTARTILEKNSTNVGAIYYLGMNLGQVAQTKTLGALKIVKEMERQFKSCLALDPGFDHHGPDRNLGLLYLEAPGWPASVGDKAKARVHLESAARGSSNYPENQLNLLDAFLRWKDQEAIQKILPRLGVIMKDSKKVFSGEQWEAGWVQWDVRWIKLRKRADEFLESQQH